MGGGCGRLTILLPCDLGFGLKYCCCVLGVGLVAMRCREGCDGRNSIDVGAWRAWSFRVCQAMRGGAIHQMGAKPRDDLLKGNLKKSLQNFLVLFLLNTNFSTKPSAVQTVREPAAGPGWRGSFSPDLFALLCAGTKILNGERGIFR